MQQPHPNPNELRAALTLTPPHCIAPSCTAAFALYARHAACRDTKIEHSVASLTLALALTLTLTLTRCENVMVSGLQSAATATLVLIDFGYAAVTKTKASAAAAPPSVDDGPRGGGGDLQQHGPHGARPTRTLAVAPALALALTLALTLTLALALTRVARAAWAAYPGRAGRLT